MALWFDLRVNSSPIAMVEIQRIEPVEEGHLPDGGDVCRYCWRVGTSEGQWTGELDHPYGNPFHLVSAVLADLDEAQHPGAAP